MAAIPIQDATAGASITFAAAAAGDTIAQGTRAAGWELAVVLVVKNANASSMTVSAGTGPTVTVPATTGEVFYPVYGVQNGQAVAVTYSSLTSVTVAAVKV